jgi:magnesium chelatase subunit H
MPKRITAADPTPMRVVCVTLDSHLAGAAARALEQLQATHPGLRLEVHAADEWGCDEAALQRCIADIGQADIIIATMLFLDDHIRAVMPALVARRDKCDAIFCGLSAGEVVRLTRLGKFSMSGEALGAIGLLKRLRGRSGGSGSSGHGQMKMLRQMPKLLRFIPGTAQDVRAYFLAMQYWLAGSEENLVNLVRMLVDRYADGPRAHLRNRMPVAAPQNYPDVGLYHPRAKRRIEERVEKLPFAGGAAGTVGVLVMRSYVLAGNTAHYDGVINALESRGVRVIPAFASGLDSRPAIDRYFLREGVPVVDAVLSLTGFSLVGRSRLQRRQGRRDRACRSRRPLRCRPSGGVPDARSNGRPTRAA